MEKQAGTVQHQLKELCESELKGVLYNVDYVNGVIFAVSAAPEIPMPDKWMLWVFDQRGQLKDEIQADRVSDILMKNMQHQLMAMRDNQFNLAQHYTFSTRTDAPVSQYLKGLLAAHALLEPVWQTAWLRLTKTYPDKLAKMQRDLRHCLMMFSTFANVPMAIEAAQRKNNQALVDNLPQIFNSLPEAMGKYVELSGALVEFMPDQFETFTQ